MVQEKKTVKLQVLIDPLLSEVLSLLSKHVRGQVSRNALDMYLKSPEGRQFFSAFNIDLETELGRRGLFEGTEPYLAEPTRVEPARKVLGKDGISEQAAKLFTGFDKTKKP